MLIATALHRTFIFNDKGVEVRLQDPNRSWSISAVLNHYTNMYPILVTAKISEPQIVGDALEYRFESIMGTKG